MKKIVWYLSSFLMLANSALSHELQDELKSKNGIGFVAGMPYTIALTYDRSISSHLSIQTHIGSVIKMSSIGLRMKWAYGTCGLSSYLFFGDVLIDMVAEDYGDPDGITHYFWFGPGLVLSNQRFQVFVEVCGLAGGNENKGIGADWIFPFDPAIGGGLIFRF